jgi:hypothetical protein
MVTLLFFSSYSMGRGSVIFSTIHFLVLSPLLFLLRLWRLAELVKAIVFEIWLLFFSSQTEIQLIQSKLRHLKKLPSHLGILVVEHLDEAQLIQNISRVTTWAIAAGNKVIVVFLMNF